MVLVRGPPCACVLRWYAILRLVSLEFLLNDVTGLIVVLKGETTLPWYAYIVALLLGGTSLCDLP